MRSPKRLTKTSLLLAAVALFLAPPRPAAAGMETPSEHYRDPNYKFSFLSFKGWAPVPIEMAGKHDVFKNPMVAQFVQQGAEKRDLMAGAIRVYRLATGASAEAPTTPGDLPPEFKKLLEDQLHLPKTMIEVFNFEIDGPASLKQGYHPALTAKAATAIKSKDGVPGQEWVIERPSPWGDKIWSVFAAWKKDDVEMGMRLVVESSQKKNYELGFKRVLDSFQWFDEKAKESASLDVLKDLPLSAAKKREIEKGLVKGWNVIVSPRKNYVVIYNTEGNRNNLLARKISEQIEEIRAQVYEVLFPPAEKVEAVSIIRVCGGPSEYFAYGGPGGSAGYWNDDSEELVFYDADPNNLKPDVNTLAVLYHEAFHQFIFYSVGEVAPHSWFNEGHGDYFAGAKYRGNQFKIGPFAWRVRTVKEAIGKGPCPYEETTDADGTRHRTWDRKGGGYSPLKALVDMDQREYYTYPRICYAQGWSLIYFLREIVPKNPAWNAKWGKILSTYFDTLKAEVNKDKPLKPKKPPKEDPPPTTPGTGPTAPTPPTGGMDGGPDPGMGGEPPPAKPTGGDDPGNPEDAMGIAMAHSRYSNSAKALRKSLDEAFKGVDFDELEQAWKDAILKVPNPKKGD